MRRESIQRLTSEFEGTHGSSILWRLERAIHIQRAPNRQRARFQVGVCPFQSQQLAAPQSRVDGHLVECLEAAPRGRVKQRLNLIRVSSALDSLAAPIGVLIGLTLSVGLWLMSLSTIAALRLLRKVVCTYSMLRSFNPFSAILRYRRRIFPGVNSFSLRRPSSGMM